VPDRRWSRDEYATTRQYSEAESEDVREQLIGSCVILCRRAVATLSFRPPSLPKSAGLPKIVTHDPMKGLGYLE